VNRTNSELDAADGISEGDLTAAREALASLDQVLGILAVAREGRQVDEDVEAWVESLIEKRNTARESRDFQRADAIRDELAEKRIVLEDSVAGTRWKIVR